MSSRTHPGHIQDALEYDRFGDHSKEMADDDNNNNDNVQTHPLSDEFLNTPPHIT